ncbi:TD and POZ domain-containing protein 4 [Caerostris extrusa]|uniref:TD and POZ domain-containing protein 4 n=1 Tax=Caerostris extrusa TaxID=172846 RepID=A0AAV4XD58_CAEEX|nr:TD and POZ domain-containing protein 4 [Caerostris extrusa]
MEQQGCVRRKCFTFTWKLENVSYCWPKRTESVYSPTFVVDTLEGTKWKLELCLRGYSDGNYIGYFFHRDKSCNSLVLELDYELSFLAADGSALKIFKENNKSMRKNKNFGEPLFAAREEVFIRRRSAFLPNDTLTARCRMWRSDNKMTESGECFARTRIGVEARSVAWNIVDFSLIEPYNMISLPIKSSTDDEALMILELFLTGGQNCEEVLNFKLKALDERIQMSTIQLILLDNEGGNAECVKREVCFNSPENLRNQLTLHRTRDRLIAAKNVYLHNDALSLLCECIFSTGVVLEEIEAVHYGDNNLQPKRPLAKCADQEKEPEFSTLVLKENLGSSFEDGFMSDVKLNAKTCSYPAHKVVLGARSPVFKAMFSSRTTESTCDSVDIQDLDDETVRRMLQYMYTADIGSLEWESASDLYAAAAKYEILTLKERCSSYLKANLRPSNVCASLILADRHHDEDFKNAVQAFILKYSKENKISIVQKTTGSMQMIDVKRALSITERI